MDSTTNRPKDQTEELRIHPAANIFPLMGEESYQALRANIESQGLREPIVFHEGRLLDGRNRLRACKELGIEPSECHLDPDVDPVAYVLSLNLHRRQLKTSQRAICAARLANLPRGVNQHGKEDVQNCTPSAEVAADAFLVSRRSVCSARTVLKGGSKKIVRRCEDGDLSVDLAAKLVAVAKGKKEQDRLVERGVKAINAAWRDHMATRTVATEGEETAAEETVDVATVEPAEPARPCLTCPTCGSADWMKNGNGWRYCTKCEGEDGHGETASTDSSPCPNCGSNDWAEDEDGRYCSKCKDPGDGAPASVKTDLGKCPNCAGTKWKEDDDGDVCAKCDHPHGEPAGDVDDDRLKAQRQKTVKTAEALMRAFDDLQCMLARPEHKGVISDLKRHLNIAKGWK